MKHTKGPWKYDGDGFDSAAAISIGTDGYTVMDEDCVPICEIDDRFEGDEQCEANARLIAAAPELVKALVRCSIIATNTSRKKEALIEIASVARDALKKAGA